MRLIHLLVGGFLESAPQETLQGLYEDDEQKQQNGGRSFGREDRVKPQADAPHQTEIEESEESDGDGIHEILLPGDLQKIEFAGEVHQEPQGKDG